MEESERESQTGTEWIYRYIITNMEDNEMPMCLYATYIFYMGNDTLCI